ncbi:hypothetical protein TSUD_129320 [Trifolium subterraneum]|uniref:Disease resistance protein At4g27190-like leucine-rich repeats domain-containing protein n=1 Tax=Trifolium subterraneum TaxID=3900 RepID=A0A2Z6NIU6_TRISU|nr:hypothetical protein TSUD_129320 [Trifolium subterraneum]
MRSSIGAVVKDLLDSCLLTRGSVKMHTMVRDAALWIANRSDDCKMLVNVDKPLSTVAEDNNIRDCFALSSWWFNESPFFCQLHAPNLKMLLVNISAHSSLNSLDLSPLTFEGIQGLQVFSLTINYKIVPISFPPSIQLLTNVRTLRLNGLMLGDISFIASLTSLEILDLRRCYFNELPIEIGKLESLKLIDLSECHISENNYNGVLRKCSQLEELYALPCYPEANVPNIIIDTDILPKLQRFVLTHSYFPKKKIFTELKNSNISQLKGSKMNILQMSETISLTGLHGGCNNIIPDMVGSLNNLSTFHLTECKEIKCIVDATCDLKEDDLIPRLVELCLKSLDNLTELCHGSPLQVLHYFEKLEVLDVYNCPQLYIIFPRQCNLRNLKILSLSYCRTDEVLFSESVAQSLQQLEQLTIKGSQELKHLIECPLKKKKHLIAASGSEHDGCSTSEEIVPAPMNLITNLRDVTIHNCQSLESIFPLCYVEGLPRLQMIKISYSPKLKYVFGKCDHEHLSSHQNLNQVTLPHLEVLKLGSYLNNFSGMCPANYQTNWLSQSLRILTIGTFPNVAIPWFNLNVGYDQRQHPLNEIWSFQCLERLTVGHCEQLKYLFSIESHRSLPELMYLSISHCQELEQIVAENEELVQLPNAESYFPKLKDISVYNCNNLKSLFPNKVLGQLPNAESVFPMLKNISVRDCDNLKSLFPLSMVTMLPQLSTLHLTGSTQLQVVFTHSQGDGIMNEIEIILPNLTDLALANLPNFVDICHGSKLHAVKLQRLGIFNCPKTASSLRIIEVTFLPR